MSVRVLIVEHSPQLREAIKNGLAYYPDIEVLSYSEDPQDALSKILKLKPDVISIDLDLPKVDGFGFLKNLVDNLHIPIVVLSSKSKWQLAQLTLIKSIDEQNYISKSTLNHNFSSIVEILAHKLMDAVKSPHHEDNLDKSPLSPRSATNKNESFLPRLYKRILLIGASTGGTQAIEALLKDFPQNCPATLIVQHMPEGFTASFAKRLDENYAPLIKEASEGEEVIPGKVLIAPGNFHLSIRKAGQKIFCHLDKEPPLGGHRPAVDVLFQSAAKILGDQGIGVILTGMGADGSQGLLAMKQAGAMTIAQNAETSIIFGMPRAAIECNAACEILPLDKIAQASIKACQSK